MKNEELKITSMKKRYIVECEYTSDNHELIMSLFKTNTLKVAREKAESFSKATDVISPGAVIYAQKVYKDDNGNKFFSSVEIIEEYGFKCSKDINDLF